MFFRLILSRFLFVFLLPGLFGLPMAFANTDEYCSERWACAGSVMDVEGAVSYWVGNRKPYPITITLMVNATNYQNLDGKARQRWEVTTVLQGNEKKSVLDLVKIMPKSPAMQTYDFDWIPGDMDAIHNNRVRYRLPFAEGSDYRVVQGYNGGYSHHGASKYALDFSMPIGTPVHAARGGVVIDLKKHHARGGASRDLAKYANFVVILHEDGTTGEYYHLRQNGVVVSIGDRIKVGQHIGYSGNTGFSSLPHLHFAVYKARSHGKFQSIPILFDREPNTYSRRGLGHSR